MKYPNIMTIESAVDLALHCQAGTSSGKYVPARPLGYPSLISRIRAAWLVFTGRADAITWTDQ